MQRIYSVSSLNPNHTALNENRPGICDTYGNLRGRLAPKLGNSNSLQNSREQRRARRVVIT